LGDCVFDLCSFMPLSSNNTFELTHLSQGKPLGKHIYPGFVPGQGHCIVQWSCTKEGRT